jgi:uncharacterized protein
LPTETIMFTSADEHRLEGRLAIPDSGPPRGAAVLCHPHPQYGGSMSSKLIPAMQRALTAAGWAALRFNFRGVGRSEGSYDHGVGEVADVIGALVRVREVIAEPSAIVGWSFGGLVGLNAAARDGAIACYAGVAPPVRRALTGKMELPAVAELDGWRARSMIVCGTQDPFCRRGDAEELVRQLPPPSEVRVVEGADHFFTGHVDELCEIVTAFVTGG